ncbi:hypothetical protein CEY12_03175 [Chryseobacterium sp. T16E-39]|uniref:hypothetical protein n=1 Tax=Chryseobacterium sp. T16E-39 TaxID=2015076 RepID=UPI000B5B15EE|nr:hypothetical protein [Chryseobacterium sp. T16E-39]ASK29168.1 hypothetical protein CEY12_03175 [Chryseobacterium sp. T16E-39]
MIFENDTLKFSGLYSKNNVLENESLFPSIINSYGVSALLMKSLEKIKDNATNNQMKQILDHHTKDYLFSITEYLHDGSEKMEKTISEDPALDLNFTLYAKTAYYKVLKEQEYLKKLINTLEVERNYTE